MKLIRKIKSMFRKDIGIDLGTANSLVYVRDQGIVLNEPSVVAVDAITNKALAVGTEAKRMLGRTPGNIRAVRPMKDGVISDFDITEIMLRHFISKVHSKSRNLSMPRVLIAVPSGITEVEMRAVKESAERAGAGEVETIPDPMAAAIGVGLPVAEPTGNMIIDIGGGTTEVAMISLAGIVESTSLKIGGDAMDTAIIDYMRKAYSLLIGERTSEDIKIKIGSAYPFDGGEKLLDVKGRDQLSGLPKTISISSGEIREALINPVTEIVKAVRQVLDRCPAELSADLIDHGIFLAGGGSLLAGLDKLLREETGLPVAVSDEPLLAVARGTGIALQEMDTLVKRSAAARKYTKRIF